jgi:hypothetical protein
MKMLKMRGIASGLVYYISKEDLVRALGGSARKASRFVSNKRDYELLCTFTPATLTAPHGRGVEHVRWAFSNFSNLKESSEGRPILRRITAAAATPQRRAE